MKSIKVLLAPIGLLMITVFFGCSKNEFTNTNPNGITSSTVDYKAVLPAQIQREVLSIAADYKFLQTWMGFWSRSGSFQSVTDEESYDFQNNFNVQVWNNNYSIATNFDFVINKAKENGAAKYEAISRIIKAQNMQTIVDVYGDVPYFGAFKGNANRTPKYDNGKDIYIDLLRQLDTAITLMQSPAASDAVANSNIETNDIAYKGNAANWVRYANTLKLRLLIHAYAVPGFDLTGEFAKIAANNGGFIDTLSEAAVNPGYSATKPNPYYRTFVQTEAGILAGLGNQYRASKYAVGTSNDGYYQLRNDPRVDRFYVKPILTNNPLVYAPNHRGIAFGEVSGNTANAGSLLSTINGPGLVPDGAASRAWLITAAESFFLQAEARQRNYITTGSTVDALVKAGIRSSFQFLGLTSSAATAYININAGKPDVDVLAAGADPIYTIVSQKWFALNSIAALEVWTDYRRTDINYGGTPAGYLVGPPRSVFSAASMNSKIPVRLFYPQTEFSFNAANVPQNIDRFTSRIFWDIN